MLSKLGWDDWTVCPRCLHVALWHATKWYLFKYFERICMDLWYIRRQTWDIAESIILWIICLLDHRILALFHNPSKVNSWISLQFICIFWKPFPTKRYYSLLYLHETLDYQGGVKKWAQKPFKRRMSSPISNVNINGLNEDFNR